MVAYSFQKQFVAEIQAGKKHQTIRSCRKNNRHARVGERLQLYTGLRTKNSQKLFERDPICTAVDDVEIHITNDGKIDKIVLNGKQLNSQEIETFAEADGFTSRDAMSAFFLDYHGTGLFKGCVIKWEAAE